MQLDHAFQNVRSKNARFQYVRKLRQNVRADATKPPHHDNCQVNASGYADKPTYVHAHIPTYPNTYAHTNNKHTCSSAKYIRVQLQVIMGGETTTEFKRTVHCNKAVASACTCARIHIYIYICTCTHEHAHRRLMYVQLYIRTRPSIDIHKKRRCIFVVESSYTDSAYRYLQQHTHMRTCMLLVIPACMQLYIRSHLYVYTDNTYI